MEEMTSAFSTVFQSERLIYTALDDSDRCKDFWWTCLANDPVTRGFIQCSRPTPPSRAASDKQLADNLAAHPLIAVLVCLRPTTATATTTTTDPSAAAVAASPALEPVPIGYVMLVRHFQDGGQFNTAFLPQHQNRGYGREALNWAVDYAFRWCRLHRLAIGCLAYNERAAHLYGSMGFVLDGRLRSCFFMNGQWHDLIEFSMLETDWKRLRGVSDD